MEFDTFKNTKLVIYGFMGGRLEIPLMHSTNLLGIDVEYEVKDQPEKVLKLFLHDLFQIKGVKEVFEEYGANLYENKEE